MHKNQQGGLPAGGGCVLAVASVCLVKRNSAGFGAMLSKSALLVHSFKGFSVSGFPFRKRH